MERVFVTGAGGYIGTTLVPALLAQGYRVRALDRFFFGQERLEAAAELECIRADCRRLRPEYFDDIDYVIDLVAISNDPSGELFEKSTYDINHAARVECARLAKAAGVKRYILPSSCSIYGFQDPDDRCDETFATNPLTTYAKANELAERDVLALADDSFGVVVLRQATVYGYSPRMRFDLAVNGMTYGAWKTGILPLMRDGSQWRPMVHVRDTVSAQLFMLGAPFAAVNGQLFNVGSDSNNYQLGPLAEVICDTLPRDVRIDWYGDPDHRSYRINFDKIEALGWRATHTARDGALEIYHKLEGGDLDRTPDTITLEWYKLLTHWHQVIQSVELHGGIVDLAE